MKSCFPTEFPRIEPHIEASTKYGTTTMMACGRVRDANESLHNYVVLPLSENRYRFILTSKLCCGARPAFLSIEDTRVISDLKRELNVTFLNSALTLSSVTQKLLTLIGKIMCVNQNQIAMVPAVVNLVASKGKDTYSGFISELTCFKCRSISTNEKNGDSGEIWKKRPPKTARPKSPQGTFKKWRKSASLKAIDLQSLNVQERNQEDEMSLLKFLAINALDLSAPASDVLLKSRSSSWFQLSGHPDSLAPAGPGTVWKKRANPSDETERMVYEEISKDPQLASIIPKYYREVDYQGEKFIELQDLLHGFQDPYVIDIKMGTRTFLESEVKNTKAREDLYQKMIAIDSNAPTVEEHQKKAVTKLRYMQFRELQSSSSSLGFRIEAMKCRGSPPVTDLKRVKSTEEVQHTLELFLNGKDEIRQRLINKIYEIRSKIDQSKFFKTREVVGSSLFVIYDDYKVGVWLIDFAKTNKLPDGYSVDHRSPWRQGNHEEGLLSGMDKLISIMENLNSESRSEVPKSIPTIKVK